MSRLAGINPVARRAQNAVKRAVSVWGRERERDNNDNNDNKERRSKEAFVGAEKGAWNSESE